MSKFIVVDVEADGPIPGTDEFSMVCFGAVVITKKGILDNTFYGQTAPISNKYDVESLSISGFSREEHTSFEEPSLTMKKFDEWINSLKGGKPIFISDNLAFDWQYINYYYHKFLGYNPFGFSGQRIGDKFQGFFNDPYYKWKQHRITQHDHNPVNDALANAEALMYLKSQGYKLF
jgi:DNA polymerase III epsilon subunit-like protein